MPQESSEDVRIYYPKYQREELMRLIKEGSERLSRLLPLNEVVLFGSFAKGRQTVASDIDLLVIYEDPKRTDGYSLCTAAFELEQLEMHVYTASEVERLRSGGSSFVSDAEKSGIVIWRKGAGD